MVMAKELGLAETVSDCLSHNLINDQFCLFSKIVHSLLKLIKIKSAISAQDPVQSLCLDSQKQKEKIFFSLPDLKQK